MKRVFLVAIDLNPRLGSECQIAHLWLKIISDHYLVEVYTDAIHKDDILKENYNNVKFHFIEGRRIFRFLLDKLRAYNISNYFFIRQVKKAILKSENHTLSLIHCITPEGLHSFNDLYKLGIPILIGPLGGGLPTPKGFKNNFYFGDFMKNIIRDTYYSFIAKTKIWKNYFLNAKHIIVGTVFIKSLLPAQAREKCVVIFDTLVDIDFYRPTHFPKNNPVKQILFSGRLESTKGIIMLIKSAKLCLNRNFGNFMIHIAGEGPLRNKIQKLINVYQLQKHITLLGSLTKSELLRKYQASDIFCLPTLREPGGTSILEAMACGLPVITSNYGGPAFSVVDECGIKINIHSYNQYLRDLANAIIKLASDDLLRKQMGIKARERAENEFSLKAMKIKIVGLYNQIINETSYRLPKP